MEAVARAAEMAAAECTVEAGPKAGTAVVAWMVAAKRAVVAADGMAEATKVVLAAD